MAVKLKLLAEGKDALLLAKEWTSRQVYWRCPRLRSWVKQRRKRTPPAPQTADREQLKQRLREIGVEEGALVMAHTSVAGLRLTSGEKNNGKPVSPIEVAVQLVDDLLALLGDSGTLVMPTHAYYQNDDEYPRNGGRRNPPVYDPASTPCSVGLANEIFRRRKDVKRSLFPYNMLAARGPLADELFRDNLNGSKPLPHGIHSGYYRFCKKNGLIVGVGTVLGLHLTLHHAGEDVRDEQWPVKDFFEEMEYVVIVGGERKTVTVRQVRSEFMKFSSCRERLRRDLVREGILHEELVGSVRVDWAWSTEVFDYLMHRNQNSAYPFFMTSLAGRNAKRA